MAYTNKSKNTASYKNFIALGGKNLTFDELGSYDFNDVITLDGRTVGELTFDDLKAVSWSNKSKSTASYKNKSKS